MQIHRNFRGVNKRIRTIGSFVLILFTMGFMSGQDFKPKTSSELYHDLQRLNFLGNVLYVAAHPDDENTDSSPTSRIKLMQTLLICH